MANNCKITKFNGTISDEQLLTLNSLRVSLHIGTDFPEARPTIFLSTAILTQYGISDTPSVRIIGNYTFTDNGLKTHAMSVDGAFYTLDVSTFPVGIYEIEIPYKFAIVNIRFPNPSNNGGMLMANHRDDAIVFNLEELSYYNALSSMSLTYQNVYGDLSVIRERGVMNNINFMKISDNTALRGTVTDLFSLFEGIPKDMVDPARNNVIIEQKLRTSLTGKLLDALEYIKSICVRPFSLDLSGFDTIDKTGITLPGHYATDAALWIRFDGNGGYTIN